MRIFKKMMMSILKFKYAKEKNVYFGRGVKVNHHVVFEGNSSIGDFSHVANSSIGYGTFISTHSSIIGCKIGRFCSLGQRIQIITGAHPTSKFVSSHPAFYSLGKQAGFTFAKEQLFEENRYADVESKTSVIIGNDVWIGSDVKILGGVKIADGSVVGAGALVTKDTEPYSINLGIPAKCTGYRFDERQRAFLIEFKWWDKDISWIKENAAFFHDVEKFCDNFKQA